jgi:hypothetical protein
VDDLIEKWNKISKNINEDNIYNPEDVMKKVHTYTHYMPSNWIERCYTYDVKNEFLSMFQYKIILFL